VKIPSLSQQLQQSVTYLLFSAGGHLHLIGVHMDACSSNADGGGVFADGPLATVTISNSNLTACTSGGRGGALYVATGARGEVYGSRITSCSASTSGGAAYVASSTALLSIADTVITGCVASSGGGLCGTSGAKVRIVSSEISSCLASDGGGAIFLNQARTLILDTEIRNNSAGNSGGGMKIVGNIGRLYAESVVRGWSPLQDETPAIYT
jgi:hypothetical protein